MARDQLTFRCPDEERLYDRRNDGTWSFETRIVVPVQARPWRPKASCTGSFWTSEAAMTRLPSFRSIEAFASAAEHSSFRKAAEQLHVTVSAVSHRIRTLEEELGVELLDRSARRIRLTRAGSVYLAGLRPALAGLHAATDNMREDKSKTVISIAAPAMLHERWLLARLPDFARAYPDADIELVSTGRRRAAGCAIIISPLPAGASRGEGKPFFDFIVSPVCAPAYQAEHDITQLADLHRCKLIEVPGLEGWKHWCAEANLPWSVGQRMMQIDNEMLIYRAAAQGLGIALGARVLTDDLIERGELVRLFDIECTLPIRLTMQVRDHGSPLVKNFADWLYGQALQALPDLL